MQKKSIILVIAILILLVGGLLVYYQFSAPAGEEVLPPSNVDKEEPSEVPKIAVENFDECVAAGNPVMESWPRQCRAGEQSFTEYIGNELEKTDLITIDSPRPNAVVTSPLEVSGQARGTWYFEASFPVKLLDGNGEEIPLNPPYIMTAEDWMTTDFVSFRETLEFETPATDTGTLILGKDNPSGLPEHDDSLIVPVKFR